MIVERVETVYRIYNREQPTRGIMATVRDDGRISLETNSGEKDFCFIESTPETIKLVAEAMIKASSITPGVYESGI